MRRICGFELFDEVSDEVGLSEKDRERYISYMQERWPDESDRWYATEWATRFLNGIEYTSSDLEGQRVLAIIDKK